MTTKRAAEEQEIAIPVSGVMLAGTLTVPDAARGLVLFAHGSGSSRYSPRNRFVAASLHRLRFATVLMDLLTEDEEDVDVRTGHLRFDIGLLAERLVAATDWTLSQPDLRRLRLGYFGASTGAGAALVAAAERTEIVRAVVSRGGRPDLAGAALARVRAPTLLIVGGRDEVVHQLNDQAKLEMGGAQVSLVIVPGATHLFEEPGALEEVARLAGEWFVMHLVEIAA